MTPTDKKTEIVYLYWQGLKGIQISKKVDVCYDTVLKILKEYGIKPKSGGTKTGPEKKLIGKKIGKLTVIELTSEKYYGEYVWLCSCECGKTTKLNTSRLTKKINPTRSCGCLIGTTKKNIYGPSYKKLSSFYWHSLIRGAISRNLEFTITKEYAWSLFEKQNKKCALSGEKIELTRASDQMKGLQTASLDRKNSNQGYVEGNVQWVHKKINIMKGRMTDMEFVSWCKKVIQNNENINRV